MTRLRRKIWKWTAALVAAVLILLAIGVGLFRLAVPMVPELRGDAEALAERALGWPVHIGGIDLQWALIGPELVLTDVQLLAPGTREPLVTAAQMDIIFGPLDFIQGGSPRPSHVRLHEPTLALERDADGVLFLSGYALRGSSDSRVDWRELLDAGLRHGRVTVIDGVLHYRDAARNIDDWTLRLVDVSLASDGEHHEFEGRIVPPRALGEQLAFSYSASGEAHRPESWRWDLEFELEEMDLSAWYRQLGWNADAQGGRVEGRLDLSGTLAGTGLEKLAGTGALQLFDAGLKPVTAVPGAERDSAPGRLDEVALSWALKFGKDRFELGVNDLRIERDDERHDDGAFSVRLGLDDFPVQLAAARLPLAEMRALARLLPAIDAAPGIARYRQAIAGFAPRGMLRELSLDLDPDTATPRFRVEAAFDDLGIRRHGELPGFSGFSGVLQGSETGGTLVLDSRDVRMDFGDLFRDALPAKRLEARLAWEPNRTGWRIRGHDIRVMNPEVDATAALTLDLPSEGPLVIDLAATARNVDLNARSAWLPVGIMSEALVRWLDTAIIDGHVPEARLALRGPLKEFPFPDGGGTFDIRFRTEATDVEYVPGWPHIEGMQADVHFNGPALDIRIEHANVMGLEVDGKARFPNLRGGQLDVAADVSGDMAEAWKFLADSPLRESLAGLLAALAPEGPLQARVTLGIPLKNVDTMSVNVAADLQEVDVHPVSLPWTVEKLEGRVTVTENAITADALAGQFTGHPFRASIVPVETGTGREFRPARIRMQGRTGTRAFESVLPERWLSRLEGEFDWAGELLVPGASDVLSIELSSTLEDVVSRLPAPLETAQPVKVTIALPEESRIDASFQLQDFGDGHLVFTETPGGWDFDRGRLYLGPEGQSGRSDMPDTPGLMIAGEVAVLDVAEWFALGAGLPQGQEAASGSGESRGEPAAVLQGFNLQADRLRVGGLVLENQAVRGTSLDRSGGWELSLSGPATGRLRIPAFGDSRKPWEVALAKLHLPDEEEPGTQPRAAASADPPNPRDLPGVMLDIGDLRIGSMTLGHVTGELRRTSIGYTTQALHAATSSYDLDLDGRWEVVKGEHYTSISAVLESRDVETTLSQLGYQGGIDADRGRIAVNLAWHAAPMAMEVGDLEGSIGFELQDGSLEEVNPGAGRLLGLFSISALPRRLMLDFSDFFGEGLSFDSLKGDFLVTDGNAYTTNVTLEGPSVSGLLVGRTGLVARDYDQLAIVDPGISASLPVAGYLAGGPTVGAALLLLSQLLKAPLADVTQVKYRITGSWDDPVIERVSQDSNAGRKTGSTNP